MGKFEHALDDKGRIAVPARLRDAIPDGDDRSTFCISRGNDGCLYLFTLKRWQELDHILGQVVAPVEKVRQRDRLLYSSAQRVTADNQGRILIPDELRKLGNITKDVVFVGLRDRIEIWDKKRWQDFESSAAGNYDQTDNEITDAALNRPRSESAKA